MTEKTITCIECPKGCLITVRLDGSKIVGISGFSCPRGKTYAENEVVCPRRILTTTVRKSDGSISQNCEIQHFYYTKRQDFGGFMLYNVT